MTKKSISYEDLVVQLVPVVLGPNVLAFKIILVTKSDSIVFLFIFAW